MLRAVLFDCDGVLVDSEPITNRILQADLASRGLVLPLEQVNDLFVGGTMESCAEEAARRGADIPVNWVTQFYEKMIAAQAEECEAVPGVTQLLDALIDRGIACAVASNGPRAKMDVTLVRTGLNNRLRPHIYTARDLGRPKPAPDIYLHAAAQLGVAPKDCVVIEDSRSGAMAAQAAGITCLGFAASGQAEALRPYCDAIFSDMTAVRTHLLG